MQTITRLSTAQLAARLNRSANTLRHWRSAGVGPQYLIINGRAVYDLATVEAWEAERTHQSTAEYDVPAGVAAANVAKAAKSIASV
jgi:hypothetical protein